MTTFTASEVRDYLFSVEERSSRQWLIAHDAELGMLRQFADLLEAQEKAVPVGQTLRDEDGYEWPAFLNIRDTKLHDDMGGLGQHIYTTAGCGYKTMKYVRQDATNPLPAAERLAEALRDCIRDLRIAAEYGKTMRNPKALLETVERAEKALAALAAQAQPPAASVTDAMVERAQDCLHDKGKDIGYYHMRATLEAALAAQENPNG